jgi:hypothetical protein
MRLSLQVCACPGDPSKPRATRIGMPRLIPANSELSLRKRTAARLARGGSELAALARETGAAVRATVAHVNFGQA